MFVRGFIAAAGNYSRFGLAAARAGNPAARWNLCAHAERRLPVADERSRTDSAGNPPAFAGRCGGVRRIFQDDDPDVPLREAHLVDDSAGPHHVAAEGFAAIAFLNAKVSRFIERRTVHADSVDDHVGGGFSESVV